MFQKIADFINLIFTALNRLANPLGGIGVPSLPSIDNPFGGNTEVGTKPKNETTKNVPSSTTQSTSGKRALVTIPENITARFASTGSPAWTNQVGPLGRGYHYGTDFGAPAGSAVYAPYAGNVIKIGEYSDSGRLGKYVMMTLGDGAEYYSGHLASVNVSAGDTVKAGQQIGTINRYNHTHVQLRLGGVLSDFEDYIKTHK